MYCRLILFQLEIKRFMKMIPLILAETLLFAIIMSGVGIYAAKAVYSDKAIGEIKIGIAAQGRDSLTKMLIKFVQSMDSMKDTVSMELMTEEEARARMETGEIYGAVVIPEGMVDSILSGENIPASILLDRSFSQAETDVFAQLASAGAKLLTTAQAGIYAADALCMESGMENRIQQTEDYLNAAYLEYALGRASVFRKEEVDAVNGTGLIDYYGISMVLAFLSLAGLSLGKCIQDRVGEREKMLSARGISPEEQYLVEAGAFSAVLSLLGMMVSLPVYLFMIHYLDSAFKAAVTWSVLVLIWAVLGSFLRMLIQITGSSAGGTGVCFVCIMAGMTVSGIFLPSAFLPVWMERIGNCFFYKEWMANLAVILQGKMDAGIPGKLFIQFLGFLAAGALVTRVKRWKQK